MIKRKPVMVRSLVHYGVRSIVLCALATSAVFLWSAEPSRWDQLSSFALYLIPILLALICCSWLSTATRFWLLLKSLGAAVSYRQALLLTFSTEFGIAASPGGVGGTAIFLTILHRAGVPLTTATSVLAADMSIDALFFILFIPLAVFSALHDTSWAGLLDLMPDLHSIIGMLLLALLLLIGLWAAKANRWLQKLEKLVAVFAFARQRRIPARIRLFRWRSYRWSRQVGLLCVRLIRRHKGVLLINLVLAAIQWIARYGILPSILLAFSFQIDPWPLIAIQGLLMTCSMFLILPGGGGGVEIAMAFVLKHFVPLSSIGAIVLLWRLFTYHINLVAGGLVFLTFCQNSCAQKPASSSPAKTAVTRTCPSNVSS